MEGGARCACAQNPPDAECNDVQNQGLPRVEANIELPVVGRDSEEEERWDKGDIGDCA
jgi:hypothetical protein